MKDLYSFDADETGLDESYQKMAQAYKNIYTRLGLPVLMVEADSGAIGGKESHEFMVITEAGEDEIIYCPNCGYAANVEKAQSAKTVVPSEVRNLLPLQEVATPGAQTIEEVANFLSVPLNQTLKAVFYSADGEFIFIVIRGDLEVNETKLKNTLKCSELRLATETEVEEADVVAGFASPIGMKGARIIADDSVTLGSNFVAGANKPGYHLKNVNYPRDFQVNLTADIALAHHGDNCPKCAAKLSSTRGIEVGHVFKLGTFLSEKFGAFFLDRDGRSQPIIMGCYGIGLGRLSAALVEKNHDDKGIIWPVSVAPYQVHLCPLYSGNLEVSSSVEKIYEELQRESIEVLLDDRDESPGVKFSDADLLGIPLRLTISPRTLKNQSVEAKWRMGKETRLLPVESVATEVKGLFCLAH
jgi:prolyl-tRNA synthetase